MKECWGVKTDRVRGLIKGEGVLEAWTDRGTHGRKMMEREGYGWIDEKGEGSGGKEGGGYVRSELQKADAGEETGCRGERITELNVWAD